MIGINEITLYELMAQDMKITMEPNISFGFDLQLADDADRVTLMNEKGVHPYAAECFAEFCVKYLVAFEQAKRLKA
jgi:hypothetical protein